MYAHALAKKHRAEADREQELFARIGPVSKLTLRYDRAGRSEGTAYVTYESKEDAEEAVRQFDGANANRSSRQESTLQSLSVLTDSLQVNQSGLPCFHGATLLIQLSCLGVRSQNVFQLQGPEADQNHPREGRTKMRQLARE